MPRSSRPLAADILLGAAAGAAATWAMDKVTTVLMEHQPEEVTEREEEVRGDKSAYEIAAERAVKLAGRKKLRKKQRRAIGTGIHWTIGIGSGAIYGVIRNRVRQAGIGSGVAFGIAMFGLLDEAALALLGLSPPPKEFPWQTHARGFAGHLVLGAVLDAAFDVADLVPNGSTRRAVADRVRS